MDFRRSLAPTVALAALSAAVAVGFTRLVTGDDWLGLVVAAAVIPHGLGLATRRRSAFVQAGVGLVGLAAYLTWAVLPATTRIGAPTSETIAELGRRLDGGLSLLRDLEVPFPPRPGIVLVMVVAVWLMATVADVLAFRRNASIGALAPAVTLFIWVAALTPAAGHAARAAGAVVVTGAAFLAVQHQVLQTARRAAVGHPQSVPAPRDVAGGVALAAVAAVVAALLAPSVPGAGADPLVRVGDRSGPSRYQTSVPPLVNVADDLQLGDRVELFAVRSTAPQYWRTVALDQYSGNAGGQWTVEASGGEIDRGLTGREPADGVRQEFTIGNLGERWMPAAFAPVSVNRPETLVIADSLTLVTDASSVNGLRYSVVSAPPPTELSDAQRRATAAPVPGSLVRYTELPADVPALVRETAKQITATATTPYDRAILLRNYFRSGSFTYDTDVEQFDSVDATVEFLTTRRGFCVQFASTYALMARAVGIPSRVAVGFTPGTFDTTTGAYRVSNLEAHAWPEVWLAGVGWTNRFEPTPPSAAPGGSDLPGDTAAAVTPSSTTPPPTTIVPGTGTPAPVSPQPGTGEANPTGAADSSGGGLPTVAWILVVVALTVGAVCSAIPVARARRRAARRRRPDPAAKIAGAWEEAVDRLRELGEPRPVATTPSEVATHADAVVGSDAAAVLTLLADAHTEAQFSATAVGPASAEAVWHDLADFDRAVAAHIGFLRRLRARILPVRARARAQEVRPSATLRAGRRSAPSRPR